MTSIRFASTEKALLRNARTVLVVGPAGALSKATMPKLSSKKMRDTVVELAKQVSPGDHGKCASTLFADKPSRLVAGVLPDEVSRHNCPARAVTIRNVVEQAELGDKGKAAILLVLDDPEHVLAAANAVGRALPRFNRKQGRHELRVEVLVMNRDGEIIDPDPLTEATVEASRDSAELVDTPPSELHPEALAKRAKAVLGDLSRVKVEEIAGDNLRRQGLGGIAAVGQGASVPPRMLIATYAPAKPRRPHIALVGKGICFDTGGLHVKGRGSMEGMKADMGGAAAVLGAFRVLAATGCPHRLSLILCLAENAVGPDAYKPDDILTLHSGKTVEINNTDAEGRLLLADGVSWAARELRADVVFDAATLTGAQLVATGLLHAAVVSNDEALEQHMVEAGQRSGDLVHPLPFAPELYKQEFASPVADMRNSVANRANAQSSCAAQFVHWHLEDAPWAKRRRWCHVDLAGPAFPRDRATGFGVALLAQAIYDLE